MTFHDSKLSDSIAAVNYAIFVERLPGLFLFSYYKNRSLQDLRSMAIPTQPSFIGNKIYLRPMMPFDFDSFYLWNQECEPQSLSCHPRLLLSGPEYVERMKKAEASDKQQHFTVCLKKDNTQVGKVGFFGLNNLNRSAELGLIVDPDQHRKGYGSEAIRILVDFLFDYRGLHKVYATTSELNEATWRLMESLGFHRDGIMRNHYFYQGEFYHQFVYSLLLAERDW